MIKKVKRLFQKVASFGPFFIIGLVLLFTTIGMYANSNGTANKTIAAAAKISVPLQTQVNGTTYEAPLVDAIPNKSQAGQGLLPVKVLVYTQYLDLILKSKGSLSVASVNPNTTVTAMVYHKGSQSTVYASYVLPEQRAQLLAAYSKSNVTVAITAPQETAGSNGTTVSTGGTSVTAGGGTAVNTQGIFTASTLPYGYAPQALAGAANYSPGSVGVALFITSFFMIFFSIRSKKKKGRGLSIVPSGKVGGLDKIHSDSDIPSTRFKDIAGCEEALDEVKELVMFIKEPERLARLNINMPKGALFVGPPGTGKTLLARAVAGEAGIPFYSVAGSDFTEVFVGRGAQRVRELFAKANKHSEGAIIFIDEIDAIAKARSNSPQGSANPEQENTLNALLVEMDGFKKTKTIVLAATNRDDVLDPAILRPGRLGKRIQVTLPDVLGREKILEVHSANKPIQENVDFHWIAKNTHGMSGADLANVVNEACIIAAREDRLSVSSTDFESALSTVQMGKARLSAVVTDEDKKLTAWHEAGHALCGLIQTDAMSPGKISIVPRGFAGGVTHFPQRESGYLKRKEAYAQLVTAFGGMAAEQALLGNGEFTTGPSSDLAMANKLAIAMVTQFGMGESLISSFDNGLLGNANLLTDEAMTEVKEILDKALRDAKEIIENNKPLFMDMINALLEYETLYNEQIEELVHGKTLTPPALTHSAPRMGHTLKPGYPRARTHEEIERDNKRDGADKNKSLRKPRNAVARGVRVAKKTASRVPHRRGRRAKGTSQSRVN